MFQNAIAWNSTTHSLIISRYSDNSNSNLPACECYEDGWDSLGMDEKRRKGRE